MLFSFPAQQKIAFALLEESDGLQQQTFEIGRYGNQELHAIVPCPPIGEHCFVLGSIAPPDERMMSFTLLAHTLKEAGAGPIVALLPYLAYSRQDKNKSGESVAAAWVGALLQASGVELVLTIDVHSAWDKLLFPIPLISLSPAKMIAAEIKKLGLGNATIVAPDNGAVPRCQAVRRALGVMVNDVPHFEKRRTDTGVIHGDLIGEVGSRVIMIDDMLDTGGTLVSAREKLIDAGVEEIYIFVTHGLFIGEKWKNLWGLRVRHIFCTDTIPVSTQVETEERITTLSVASLLQDQLVTL